MLIISYCARKNKNITGVLAWAKLITDWHEDFSVNGLLDRAMDTHNNEIGRLLAKDIFAENEEKMIEIVQNATKMAQKVTKIEEIDQFMDELVYLES